MISRKGKHEEQVVCQSSLRRTRRAESVLTLESVSARFQISGFGIPVALMTPDGPAAQCGFRSPDGPAVQSDFEIPAAPMPPDGPAAQSVFGTPSCPDVS